MKICIIAAGLATRLQPFTNYVPKCLINIGKSAALVQQIQYWNKFAFANIEFIIVVHPKFESVVKEYLKIYFNQLNFKIKTIDEAAGTAHAIKTALRSSIDGEEVIISWCDVIPGEDIHRSVIQEKAQGKEAVVFTTNNKQNRYSFVADSIVPSTNNQGDVFGVFYFPKFKGIEDYQEGDDLVDVLARRKNLAKHECERIIDFGDKSKLLDVLKDSDNCREFNSIEFSDKWVLKKSTFGQGNNLLRREINWYKAVNKNAVGFHTPSIYPSIDFELFDLPEIVMNKVNGVPLYEIFGNLSINDKVKVLDSVVEDLNYLHARSKETTSSVIAQDIKKESHDKLIDRYESIEPFIQSFGKNISNVNGMTIDNNVRKTIDALYERISSHYKGVSVHSLIHGDSQMSNIMINPNKLSEITFIDPRGYFGDTEIYGLPDYDFAKLLYSLTGYDASLKDHSQDVPDMMLLITQHLSTLSTLMRTALNLIL